MVREIVKLAALAAVILIAAVLVALFASGYISAFKPGGSTEPPGEHVMGGSSSITGRTSVVSPLAPSPSPPPMPPMEEGMQPLQPMAPGTPPGQAIQPLQEPIYPGYMEGPAMPVIEPPQPSAALPEAGPGPRIIQDRPGRPPFAGPTARPLLPVEPLPLPSPEPSGAMSPFVKGWMLIIQRFVTILPYLFPGISPLQTWWPEGL